MKESELEILEKFVKEERERITIEEKEAYEAGPHKSFSLGDWVTDGEIIGTVHYCEEVGYLHINIKNKNGGLLGQTRSDKYVLVDDEVRDYYTQEHELVVFLTGEDIEAILRKLGPRNYNPSKSKDKLLDALEKLR